ncbi:MAG: DUF4315 family protein [Oscillospiraceae bacterium]|nr:DUF4315 family protein [Oscillospiraceae bacterium]
MNPKVEKLREERAKNCAKIEKLTARNKVIDEAIESLENSDIVGLVREQGLTPDELAKLLTALKAAPLPTEYIMREESHE